MKYSVSKLNLLEISETYYYNRCPICENKLIEKVKNNSKTILCKNRCYIVQLSIYPKQEQYIIWDIKIYGHHFPYFDKIYFNHKNSVVGLHFDDRYHYVFRKRIENLIRYYRYNDRYLMKLLMG